MQKALMKGAGLLLLAGVTACQPDSITEARDQLGRGDPTTFSISVPITSDTFSIDRFLDEGTTVTTAGGLLGIKIDSQNVSVAVGEALEFSGLSFDAFNFGYEQMLSTDETSTTVMAPSPPAPGSPMLLAPGDITFATPNGSGVQSATIATGLVVRTISNGTVCDADVSVTTTDGVGDTVITFPTVRVVAGTSVTDTTDADGKTMVDFVRVVPGLVLVDACILAPGSSVAVTIVFKPMTLASVTLTNIDEPFSDSYAALAGESRLQAIDTVVAQSGSFTLTAQNKLPIALNFAIQLQGIFRNGTIVSGNLVIPAAPGDGSTTSRVLIFDMTGATIVPSEVLAVVNGSAVASLATITPAAVANAVTVSATGDLVVDKLIGSLDPAQTPELTVTVEDFVTVSSSDFDFGDFEDAIQDATINNAEATIVIGNSSGVPITLQNFTMSVAQIDPATGEPQRDGNGDFVLELDGSGNPIAVVVADSGGNTLAIARSSSTSITVELAPVADKLIKLALDNGSAALVATGTAVAGDGTQSSISRSDAVDFSVNIVVGLDLTLPAAGVSFQLNEVESGAEMDAADADEVAARIGSAGVSSTVTNGTPFALMIEVAFVEGSAGVDVDVFQRADAVVLTPVTVAAPAVNAQGIVTTPTLSQVSVSLTGAEIRQVLGDYVTTSIRITLLPGSGGGGRAAVRPTDKIILSVFAEAEIVGGSQ